MAAATSGILLVGMYVIIPAAADGGGGPGG